MTRVVYRDFKSFHDETYYCGCSEDNLSDKTCIEKEWFCNKCNQFIEVVLDGDNGENIIFNRIKANKIEVDMRVNVDIYKIYEFHYVLGINALENGKLGIGLEGYGRINVDKNYFINCRVDDN
ncbi:hypothetical protein [Proteus cibi]|uniref:hypothetical protein n=1 Tax=Proteus cibi TaxID=2050966 RepID=UPI0035A6B877